jgi:hypothetical protein
LRVLRLYGVQLPREEMPGANNRENSMQTTPPPSTHPVGHYVAPWRQRGKIGWLLLWLIGVPVPVLLGLFLLRGCT